MSHLFDVYIAVDWSARSVPSPRKPARDAIWVAEALAADSTEHVPPVRDSYWQTRLACRLHLRDRLLHHIGQGRRVFLGFDFAYGYPSGFAQGLNLPGDLPAWRKIWNELSRLIQDDENNHNNRFEVAATLNERCGGSLDGPFWGCPADCQFPALRRKSPAQGYPYVTARKIALERLRWADKSVRGIQPVWKLLGSGCVGGQTLMGIPTVCKLRDNPLLAPVSRVWPFETGFTPSAIPRTGPFILHAEIWPSIAPNLRDHTSAIPDQGQVRAVVCWLRKLDTSYRLYELFAQPEELSDEMAQACIAEEGWITGAGWLNRETRII
jgi:hypothetical protein